MKKPTRKKAATVPQPAKIVSPASNISGGFTNSNLVPVAVWFVKIIKHLSRLSRPPN